jgi:hypothetical protein
MAQMHKKDERNMTKPGEKRDKMRTGGIGRGWYEETEEDIEHQRLQNIAALSLKQKLDEVFGLISLRHQERRDAIKKGEKQKSICGEFEDGA